MTIDTNAGIADPVRTALQALATGDAVAAASVYAEDGVFVDPQYPASTYRGRESIREALEWAAATAADGPDFSILRYLSSAGTHAIEAETRLIGRFGQEPSPAVPQVFVVDVEDDEITRWRTYLPFAPDGDDPERLDLLSRS